jgi:hypothetical protein
MVDPAEHVGLFWWALNRATRLRGGRTDELAGEAWGVFIRACERHQPDRGAISTYAAKAMLRFVGDRQWEWVRRRRPAVRRASPGRGRPATVRAEVRFFFGGRRRPTGGRAGGVGGVHGRPPARPGRAGGGR